MMGRPVHTPDAIGLLEAYAVHLGIPIQALRRGDYPMWDGSALMRPTSVEDWAHEIAHWLLASPERRRIVNYGWGQDAEFVGYDPAEPELYGFGDRPDLDRLPWPDPKAPWPETSEEVLACVLGFAFMVRAGVDATGTYDAYGFYRHEWYWSFRWRTDDEGPVKVIESNTYRERRAVQSQVAAFEAWRAGT